MVKRSNIYSLSHLFMISWRLNTSRWCWYSSARPTSGGTQNLSKVFHQVRCNSIPIQHIDKLFYTQSLHYKWLVNIFSNTCVKIISIAISYLNLIDVFCSKVIRSCKRYITNSGRDSIWSQDRDHIEVKLTECIKLNDHYR